MRRILMMPVVLSAVGLFAFSACRDDSDGIDGNGNGDGNGNQSAALDCNTYGTDVYKCDYAICALGTSGDSCYDDFRNCYMTACPSGSDVTSADASTLSACSQTYASCLLNGGDSDDGSADDPFDGVDCTSTDVTSCDYSICAYEDALDQALSAWDCSTMQQYCDGYTSCYATFVDCYVAACPAGTSVANADLTAVTECANSLTSCVSNI